MVAWLIIGNIITLIGMIRWRGNTDDAPILADILVAIWYIWIFGLFCSMAAFSKFVWHRLQPMSVRQLYDNRRRNNVIDAFITVLLPLLWFPTFLISCSARYYIIEDIGPTGSIWISWTGFFITTTPTCLPAVAIAVFSVLALLSHLRSKRNKENSNPSFVNASVRTRKLIFMSFANLLLSIVAFGITVGKFLQYYPVSTWGESPSIAENVQYLQVVVFVDRFLLDTQLTNSIDSATTRLIITPLLGVYLFVWFGFTAEARSSYRKALEEFIRLVGIKPKDTKEYKTGWASIISPFNRYQVPSNHRRIPYLGAPNKGRQDVLLPSESAPAYHPGHSDEVIDIKREDGSNPPSRLSLHKPPFVPLAPVGAPPERPPPIYTSDPRTAPPLTEKERRRLNLVRGNDKDMGSLGIPVTRTLY